MENDRTNTKPTTLATHKLGALQLCMVAHGKGTRTKYCSLELLVRAIQGGKWREQIEAIRNEPDEAKRKLLKLKLPAILFHATMPQRANKYVLTLTGLMCIDMDHLSPERFAAVRAQIESLHSCLFSFRSPFDGLKAVFYVSEPIVRADHGLSIEQLDAIHEARFIKLAAEIEALTGHKPDEGSADMARNCYVSFDQDTRWLNHEIQIVHPEIPAPAEPKRPAPAAKRPGPWHTPQNHLHLTATANLIDVRLECARSLGAVILDPFPKVENAWFIECPGKDLHTNADAKTHTVLYLGGAPNAQCQHQSCQAAVHEFNKNLQSACGKAEHLLEKLKYKASRLKPTLVPKDSPRAQAPNEPLDPVNHPASSPNEPPEAPQGPGVEQSEGPESSSSGIDPGDIHKPPDAPLPKPPPDPAQADEGPFKQKEEPAGFVWTGPSAAQKWFIKHHHVASAGNGWWTPVWNNLDLDQPIPLTEPAFWRCVGVEDVKRLLARIGIPTGITTDNVCADIASRPITRVMELAPYPKGLHTLRDGSTLLCPVGPRRITPAPGSHDLFDQFCLELLGLKGTFYFYAWLKHSLSRLHNTKQWKASLILVLAGPAGVGKSMLQSLITILLGGRDAKPWSYLCGETTHNGELFGAEHHTLEDVSGGRFLRDADARIKEMYFSSPQRCRPMYKEAFNASPVWAVSMSANTDPKSIQVIPAPTEDMRDKILGLNCAYTQMLSSRPEPEQREALYDAIAAELPALAHHLLHEFDIPDKFKSGRTGIQAYLSPEIFEAMDEASGQSEFKYALFRVLRKAHPAIQRYSISGDELFEELPDLMKRFNIKSVVGLGRILSPICIDQVEKVGDIGRVRDKKERGYDFFLGH